MNSSRFIEARLELKSEKDELRLQIVEEQAPSIVYPTFRLV